MKPTAVSQYSVKATCPDCAAVAVFAWKEDNRECGFVVQHGQHFFNAISYAAVHWRLLRCSNCGRAALASFHEAPNHQPALDSFLPRGVKAPTPPSAVPEGIRKEYDEAALCASVSAWRAASALLRSALEKTLKANGYVKGGLQDKIDLAATDGVITDARRKRAHEDVRVLGNEVVHDEWRAVTEDEVDVSLHYVQRILEDFYDDRKEVEKVLLEKGRIAAKPAAAPT
jgi:hypothetical protein